jgi:hypothetical protein
VARDGQASADAAQSPLRYSFRLAHAPPFN